MCVCVCGVCVCVCVWSVQSVEAGGGVCVCVECAVACSTIMSHCFHLPFYIASDERQSEFNCSLLSPSLPPSSPVFLHTSPSSPQSNV